MASIAIIKLDRIADSTKVVPTFTIEARITTSVEGESASYYDWTGKNALTFPDFLSSFSADQIQDVAQYAVQKLLEVYRVGVQDTKQLAEATKTPISTQPTATADVAPIP